MATTMGRTMRARGGARSAGVGLLLAMSAGCEPDELGPAVDDFTQAEWEKIREIEPLGKPVPADPSNRWADDPGAAALGQALFFTRDFGVIAVDGPSGLKGERGKLACVTCHDPNSWFDDSRNMGGASHGSLWTERHPPSLVNVAYYKWHGWAGKQDSLWMQGANSFEGKSNFNSNRLEIAHVLFAKYRQQYDAVFEPKLDPALDPGAADAARFPLAGKPKSAATDPDGPWELMAPEDRLIITRIMANVGKAIAAYERRLVSRNSPFERYVKGETGTMSASAKRGLKLFIGKAACNACHSGPSLSDNKFYNTGVPQAAPNLPVKDTGHFDDGVKITRDTYNLVTPHSDDVAFGQARHAELPKIDETFRGRFRTKSLLQIAMTGPYFHNGSAQTLQDVIRHYNAGGGAGGFEGTKDALMVPLNLTESEQSDLVEFLTTLTGEPVPAELTKDPAAP
jgi:cytochrome c peroxidase